MHFLRVLIGAFSLSVTLVLCPMTNKRLQMHMLPIVFVDETSQVISNALEESPQKQPSFEYVKSLQSELQKMKDERNALLTNQYRLINLIVNHIRTQSITPYDHCKELESNATSFRFSFQNAPKAVLQIPQRNCFALLEKMGPKSYQLHFITEDSKQLIGSVLKTLGDDEDDFTTPKLSIEKTDIHISEAENKTTEMDDDKQIKSADGKWKCFYGSTGCFIYPNISEASESSNIDSLLKDLDEAQPIVADPSADNNFTDEICCSKKGFAEDEYVNWAEFTPHGNFLVARTNKDNYVMWDTKTGEQTRPLHKRHFLNKNTILTEYTDRSGVMYALLPRIMGNESKYHSIDLQNQDFFSLIDGRVHNDKQSNLVSRPWQAMSFDLKHTISSETIKQVSCMHYDRIALTPIQYLVATLLNTEDIRCSAFPNNWMSVIQTIGFTPLRTMLLDRISSINRILALRTTNQTNQ